MSSWRFSESLRSGDCRGYQPGSKNVTYCKNCGKSQVLHVIRSNEVKGSSSSASVKHFFCCVRNCRAVFANIDVPFCLSIVSSYWSELLQRSRRVIAESGLSDMNRLNDSIISLQNFYDTHPTLVNSEDIPRLYRELLLYAQLFKILMHL